MAGKRVLIVSASIGSGHNQAAKAMAAALTANFPGIETQIEDFMAGEQSYFNRFIKEAYFKMLHVSPNMYDFLYNWSKVPERGSKVQNLLVRLLRRKVFNSITMNQPDLVVFTHPFPCAAAAQLKIENSINVPLVVAITDFAAHPLWVYKNMDVYFAATPDVAKDLSMQGVERSQILVTGIPIAEEFSRPADKQGIIKKLNLRNNSPVVLIMGGGLGLGGVTQALNAVEKVNLPLQVIVIAGKNPRLRHDLQKTASRSRHKVTVLGYTTRIRDLMAAATLLITKPGALTTSEAMAVGTPILLYESIPGQEKENATYLTRHGAAIWVQKCHSLSATIATMLTNKIMLDDMRNKALQISKPRAAVDAAVVMNDILQKNSNRPLTAVNGWREKHAASRTANNYRSKAITGCSQPIAKCH